MEKNYKLPSIDLLDKINHKDISFVPFRLVTASIPKEYLGCKLLIPLGIDNGGNTNYYDLSKCNNVLIGGRTGSGKSVFLNSIICSVLMRSKPNEVQLLLIDTKELEFPFYNGIPHLMSPSIAYPKKASIGLQRVVKEMERRYEMLSYYSNVKNIEEYNKINNIKMPYILVIIDELSDLMLICQNEIEDSFRWITEKGKDVGIHLIVSTQKPSPRLIDILNSKNDLTRISFMATPTDLNTTIGMKVKEKPSIKGEMLFRPYGTDEIKMIVGPYVSEEEISKLVDFYSSQQETAYDA